MSVDLTFVSDQDLLDELRHRWAAKTGDQPRKGDCDV